jgi:hypothetical protein
MGRTRRTSKVLETAQVRAANIKHIDATLDLGGGLTVASFDAAIGAVQSKLADYNQALAAADEKSNTLDSSERMLRDLSERMLAGIGARFGKDSSEYEQAGGVRKSDRKFPPRKTKATPPTP